MERDETHAGSTYEEDALGVPDHTTSSPDRDPEPPDQQVPPAEEPRGADTWGTTAAEQRAGAPLDDRLAAEVPDGATGAGDEALRILDDGTPDDEAELASTATGSDLETPSAEEAAVHTRLEAPGGIDGPDLYVEDADEEASS